MKIEIEHNSSTSEQNLGELEKLEKDIFEYPMSKGEFIEELDGRKNVLISIAYSEGEPCGYKLGYEYSKDIFFSLSGGVAKNHRRKGVSTQLMKEQHDVLRGKGYSFVRTHTKNKYREMLLLNIKNGFDVTGVYKSLKEKHPGIILEKGL